MRPQIIGISGGSGGGKTLLATMLCLRLGLDNTVLLSLDSYYKNQVDVPLAVRGISITPIRLIKSYFLTIFAICVLEKTLMCLVTTLPRTVV